METQIFITKDETALNFGWPAAVTLTEPLYISRQFIRRVIVELPEGFDVAENQIGEKKVFGPGGGYDLAVDANGNPVIIDHLNFGKNIKMRIVREGWDETISLTEYAKRHNKAASTVRQMALRGGFKTARKVGRDWLIDESEPYPDARVKTGKYKKSNQHE